MAGNKEWGNVCNQVNTCALSGAAAFFAGIPDAAIVANGPLWCYFYALRSVERACPDIGRRFFSTQPDDHAVVYGTEECLLETLSTVRQSLKPSVLLIENSCAVSLIGDDVAGIAAQADLACPVICMDSGGMTGGFWEGYRAAAQAYFAAMPLGERRSVKPGTVNLLGCTIGYYNSGNDQLELKRMLTLAGYKVLAAPGAGSTTTELAAMLQADINLVVHAELGLETAQYLQRHYGIPYLSLLPPYGIEGSLNWLQAVGDSMWADSHNLQVLQQEAYMAVRHMAAAIKDMERIWGKLWFEHTVLAGPSSVVLSMAQALHQEWGGSGAVTAVLHDGAAPCLVPDCVDILLNGQQDSKEIGQQLHKLQGGLLLGSSQEKALVQQMGLTGVMHQNIALPVYDELILTQRPFMGLRGAGYLAERLWNQYIGFCQGRSLHLPL